MPNALHIGHQESLRLLGEHPVEGPFGHAMDWAYRQDPADLGIIHIRDWHHLNDLAEREHLERF